MDNNFEQYRHRLLAVCESELENPNLQNQISLRKEYNAEFPIERLEQMSLEDYAIGHSNDAAFCYQLEFGRFGNAGIRIGGGSSLKYGIYFDKDNQVYKVCRAVGNKPVEPAEGAEAFWLKFRNQLCTFLREVQDNGAISGPVISKYPLLKGMGMVLQKLCFLYRPDKFINGTHRTATYTLNCMGISYRRDLDRVELTQLISQILHERAPEFYTDRYDPQVIGNAMYTIWKEDNEKDKPERIQAAKERKRIAEAGTEEDQDPEQGGENIIYYGTPGCGKSYLVKQSYEGSSANSPYSQSYRTIFHPDYTNSDFIGQIIPAIDMDGKITYQLAPGPFTQALEYALQHPAEKVSLIIDEINRGNAAAIFGDILQLLDRDETGQSIYGIRNYFISSYLAKKDLNTPEITIPSNLTIVATMNTSDQNVFPLDTAFKRRWIMRKVINDFNQSEGARAMRDLYVPGTAIKWSKFVTDVNRQIARTTTAYGLNAEDKQLGVFFVKREELSETPNNDAKIATFGEKILMYLWEDVAKINRTAWFGGEYHTLDELLDGFKAKHLAVFKDLFNETTDD